MNARILLAAALVVGVALAGCTSPNQTLGPAGPPESFRQAGSSTVLPIAEAWAEEFHRLHTNVQFSVEGGGSGAGLQKFCRGEVDIADASRPINAAETTSCKEAGIDPFEVQVAIDGLAVVVSKQNDFVDKLTVQELNRLWTDNKSKQANRWSELRPSWPAETIQLFGPGTNSGTFDYFVEVIIHPFDGKTTKGRSDYTPSEDDNVLVRGVSQTRNGLGYFGLAYAAENTARLRIVPIDAGKGAGAVLPTPENVASGKYAPLSRPLFMYTDGAPKGPLKAYFEFGLGADGQQLVEDVGYIQLPADKQKAMLAKVGGG